MTNDECLMTNEGSHIICNSSFVIRHSSFFLRLLPLGFGLLDGADVHEGVFRQVVPLAVADFFEAADRFGQRRDLARLAGEHFGHEERLRQEPLDAAGAMHDQLVVFAQFVDAENRDDVLQFAVALQNRLHAAGDVVVPLAHVLRIENSAADEASGSTAG